MKPMKEGLLPPIFTEKLKKFPSRHSIAKSSSPPPNDRHVMMMFSLTMRLDKLLKIEEKYLNKLSDELDSIKGMEKFFIDPIDEKIKIQKGRNKIRQERERNRKVSTENLEVQILEMVENIETVETRCFMVRSWFKFFPIEFRLRDSIEGVLKAWQGDLIKSALPTLHPNLEGVEIGQARIRRTTP